MPIDFYNLGLNPITMFGSAIKLQRVEIYRGKEGNSWIKDHEVKDYVCARILRKELNIGGKKLKGVFALFGAYPRYNRSLTYYPTEHLDKVKSHLAERKEQVDMSEYITNQELISMFNFTPDKAFHIANREKLTKIRFSGNVNYFNKHKAIAVFEKYKK